MLSKLTEAAPSVLQARAAVLRRSISQTNTHRYTPQYVAPFWSSLWTPASEDHHGLISCFDLLQSIRHQLATSPDQKAAHQDEEDTAACNTTPVQAMGSCSDVLRRKGSKATSPPLLFASLEEAVLTDMVLCCCSWSCRPRTAQARGNGMPLCCSGTRTHRSKQDLPGELWCSGTWKQLGLAINHWLLATPRDERQKSPTYDRFLLI